MIYLRALALTIIPLLASVALAHAECRPLADVIAATQGHPRYASHVVLTNEAAVTAGEFYNSMPPRSDEKVDVAVLVSAKDGSGALLVGRDGTICGALNVPAPAWRFLLDRFLGIGS